VKRVVRKVGSVGYETVRDLPNRTRFIVLLGLRMGEDLHCKWITGMPG